MIYSQATTYSLEALAYLAGIPEGSSAKTREMATALNIPEHFLGKIMSQLAKKKLVSSSKGPTGGFTLEVDPEKVNLYRLLAVLDSLTSLEEDCVMGLKKCSDEHPCALHDSWIRFKEEAVKRAQKLTLAEFSKLVQVRLHILEDKTDES